MTIQLYNGDCLEVMRDIPDQSVDMILCDLPYGTTQNRWDSIIPLDDLWGQYKRVIRPGAAVVLFCQVPFSIKLGASNLEWLRYEWIWQKANPTGFLNANRAPMKEHENILVFCEKAPPYNPQRTPSAKKNGMSGSGSSNYGKYRNKRDNPNNYGNFDDGVESTNKGYSMPKDILFWASDPDKVHPTQKPVGLCEYLIRTYTDEGMTVLDNCMGSGTTGVASVRTGRSFVGIELDPEYFRIASDRISSTNENIQSRCRLEDFMEESA